MKLRYIAQFTQVFCLEDGLPTHRYKSMSIRNATGRPQYHNYVHERGIDKGISSDASCRAQSKLVSFSGHNQFFYITSTIIWLRHWIQVEVE